MSSEVKSRCLSKSEFCVLRALAGGFSGSQKKLSEHADVSVGTVNRLLKEFEEIGYTSSGSITRKGALSLEPYRVRNAVILAAGMSTRFAPISYEKPKGVMKVRGEVLIERQIEQLREAGVADIAVVVGYKKEYFFYLKEKYGVDIVVNSEFVVRNNNSSLMAAKDLLGSTYICSSDNYFVENPFDRYEWKSFYAAEYAKGDTKEWCITTTTGNRIASVKAGGADSWYMIGHAYFDEEFARRFMKILGEEYQREESADKLWESIYVDHIKELDMVMKPFEPGIIYEFDSLDDVRAFDPLFLENVDSDSFDNIVSILGCEKTDIYDVYPLKQGLTNLSCHFRVGSEEYVYRHPGVGTENLIDRRAEMRAQKIAKELGLDDTFIYEDPKEGWKISRFLPNCSQLDPHDAEQLAKAMSMGRALHESGAKVERCFDFYEEGKRYESLLLEKGPIDVPGYWEMAEKAQRLRALASLDGSCACLAHNDFFMLNFLIDNAGQMFLIDWEYAGMSDYAQDFGTFVVCCQLSHEEAERALEYYFERTPTFEERCHNFAFVALAGWCWYVWSLVKEAEGECIGEWLYIYYSYAREYMDKVLSWYTERETNGVLA